MAIFNEMQPEEPLFDEKHEASFESLSFRWEDEAFPMQKEDHQEQNQKSGGTRGILHMQAV